MKKLFLFIALMFAVAAISEAQTATISPSQTGGTYAVYTTDVVLTNTTAKWFQYNFEPVNYNAQNFIVQLDSTSGNVTSVACALYGRISDVQGWTAIGSAITWGSAHAGAGADTTILFAASGETAYRQFKLLFTPAGTGTATVLYQAVKIWNDAD